MPQPVFQLPHPFLRAVDMGGQAHVVLKMFEVVTHELCDDSILLCNLLPERAELLFQGLDMTKLFSLHDHRIVRAVHHVIRLEVKSVDCLKADPQFDLPWTGHLPSNGTDWYQRSQPIDDTY